MKTKILFQHLRFASCLLALFYSFSGAASADSARAGPQAAPDSQVEEVLNVAFDPADLEEAMRAVEESTIVVPGELEEDCCLTGENPGQGPGPGSRYFSTLSRIKRNPLAGPVVKLALQMPSDLIGVVVAPKGWKRQDWLKASAIVGAGALLMTQDQKIREWTQAQVTPTSKKVSFWVEKLGPDATTALIPAYLVAHLIRDDRLKKATLYSLENAAIVGILNGMLKVGVGRHRPFQAENQWEFSGPGLGTAKHSFASGHTASAFAVATTFAEVYHDNKAVAAVAYSAATLVGLSRIHDNRHWASDVLMGAALGHFGSKLVTQRHLARDRGRYKWARRPKAQLYPSVGPGGVSTLTLNVWIDQKKPRLPPSD